MNNPRFSLLNKLIFPGIVCKLPEKENKIYLTFDDGPTPEITTQVLSILLKYNVKATFFCRGDHALEHRRLFQRVADEGHVTGNHGFSHLHGWYTSTGNYINDCRKAADIIPHSIFRPPYGKLTPAQYKILKNDFTIYLWSALSWDFHPYVSPGMCCWYSAKNMFPGSILVFHDTLKASSKLLYTLPRIIESGFEKGYQFSSLPVNTRNDRTDSAEHESF